MIRASRATAFPWLTARGLMSISRISGKSMIMLEKPTRIFSNLAQIGGGFPPVALEHAVDARLLHEPPGQGLVQGRQADGEIPEQLHADPPHAEEDDGAEVAVLLRPQDEFVVDVLDHLLDGHAPNRRLRGELADPVEDALVGGLQRLVGIDPRDDASHVLAEDDVRGGDLEDHGVADLSRRAERASSRVKAIREGMTGMP